MTTIERDQLVATELVKHAGGVYEYRNTYRRPDGTEFDQPMFCNWKPEIVNKLRESHPGRTVKVKGFGTAEKAPVITLKGGKIGPPVK